MKGGCYVNMRRKSEGSEWKDCLREIEKQKIRMLGVKEKQ